MKQMGEHDGKIRNVKKVESRTKWNKASKDEKKVDGKQEKL